MIPPLNMNKTSLINFVKKELLWFSPSFVINLFLLILFHEDMVLFNKDLSRDWDLTAYLIVMWIGVFCLNLMVRIVWVLINKIRQRIFLEPK